MHHLCYHQHCFFSHSNGITFACRFDELKFQEAILVKLQENALKLTKYQNFHR